MKRPTPEQLPVARWGDEPDYPWADWVYAVQNNDTRRGYPEWVQGMREENA